jgi:hypothetical protein
LHEVVGDALVGEAALALQFAPLAADGAARNRHSAAVREDGVGMGSRTPSLLARIGRVGALGRALVWGAGERRLLCRFSDAGDDEASQQARMPASEKRQGTKSRGSGHRRCRGLYGDLATASGWARSDRNACAVALP